jgi:hypothetical protein
MDLIKLKILDSNFGHCIYSNNPLPPTSFSSHIVWDRNVTNNEELVFYTDGHVKNPNPGHKQRVAWLLEPYEYCPDLYEWVLNNNNLYNMVLTTEKKLLDKGENFIFYPFGGCWVEENNRKITHNKNKLVSIIASDKKLLSGHKKRHEIINKFGNKLDVMGRGYKPIDSITEGLAPYMFSIVIENQNRDYFFSEKLINPLMTGTIPIYWGMPSIDQYFDTRGMIILNSVDDFKEILPNLTVDYYNAHLPYIENNFKLAQQYILAEDWIYNNVFEK